ncbi:response regulator aspartate phosphatase [Bacillus vallismortis]|uniref:response regulator aspartate phosphatase n=1 Tax=Bacillus vallismortis TaxID=72361 RepID=UPI0020919F3F|nr:tetratricopeptide repeat protein [Bacillus vallismortis]MCO4850693.1 tetratricopeptide repeat protein [Bacillus vallismortis]
MEQLIPSSTVGVKINEWYKYIRMFAVPDAEILKAEVEEEIKHMEEDQDLLLYYSLMCFRHQLMLDYLEPKSLNEARPKISDLLEKIESSQTKLKGVLEYYGNFFKGMNEFDKKEYIKAIRSYKIAEKKLALVTDEIERAEFYFKMAEVYYHMKQTHVSMHYAEAALNIYKDQKTYTVRRIQCAFVVAGNFDDLESHEKAVPHLRRALKDSKAINKPKLIGASLYNLGNCYYKMKEYNKAAEYIEQAVSLYENDKSDLLPHTLFTLTQTYFKMKDIEKAFILYKKGIKKAQAINDDVLVTEFNYLKALYIDSIDKRTVFQTFSVLKDNVMYPDLEELALDTANYCKEIGQFENSTTFFDVMVDARIQIQRGECLYEI